MKVLNDMSKCYGCGKCSAICPVSAIHMEQNEEGFLYPLIDTTKCINCGLCENECIVNIDVQQKIILDKVYACYADEKSVSGSTSGGIFYQIARQIINDGGAVYGAKLNDDFLVVHERTADLEELESIRGSKYVQSDISEIFQSVVKDVKEGRRVLFSGTGCQVGAVKSLIGDDKNLVCVEVACMGCPSPGVWKRYLNEYIAAGKKVKGISCRDKSVSWEEPLFSVYGDNWEKKERYEENAYMTGFGQAMFLRPTCHDCHFKGNRSMADIKIGDFWGISKLAPDFYNKNGTSVVIVQTENGNNIFESIKENLSIKTFRYKEAVLNNPYFELSIAQSKKRELFFQMWKNGDKLETIVEECKNHIPTLLEITAERYVILEKYCDLLVEGKETQFFEANEYKNIAFYGINDFARLIANGLKKSGVKINYFIDKSYYQWDEYVDGIKVISPVQVDSYDIDCIVVVPLYYNNNILETLLTQEIDLNKVVSIRSIFR